MELLLLAALGLIGVAASLVFGVFAGALGIVFALIALPFCLLKWTLGALIWSVKSIVLLPVLAVGLFLLALFVAPFVLLAALVF